MAGSFIRELKRRNVFRVAVVYIVVSWLLMQVGDVMFGALLLPAWTTTLLAALLILGLPLVIIFAWAFELTPDGVVKTSEVPAEQSITADTGRKINYTIIAVLALAVVVLLFKDTVLDDEPPAPELPVADQSIAVLPFKNQSASEENAEFFAGGLHDELLTLLSKLGDLKVISRTSVERLDPDLSIPQIGDLLGVSTVLEGQVQRAGDRLRINVQLIDTTQEGHLWANTYDSELTAENVFDVQSDIARTIANALHAELSPDDVETLDAVPTTNTEALEKYLLAMQVAKRRSFDALRLAEEYLVDVTEMDPNFSEAWSSLAYIRGELFMTGAISDQQFIEGGGAASDKALELNPRDAIAWSERARVQFASGNLSDVEASLKKSIKLGPQNSDVHENYGEWLRHQGRLVESRDILTKGLEFDPLSLQLIFQLGRVEMYMGNPEANLEAGYRLLEIAPSTVSGYVALLQANIWRGRFDEAWQWYVRTLEADPEDYETWSHVSLFLDTLGATELSDRYRARADQLGRGTPVYVKCTAMILTQRGDPQAATELARMHLAKGIDNRWDSDRVLLRTLRDGALRSGNFEEAVERYREYSPLLSQSRPVINSDNLNQAADFAALLQAMGEEDRATELLNTAIDWYKANQPEDVYGYIHGIALVELYAVAGDVDAAIDILERATDQGYLWQWKWLLTGPNFNALRGHPKFEAITETVANRLAEQREALLASPHYGDFDLRDRQ